MGGWRESDKMMGAEAEGGWVKRRLMLDAVVGFNKSAPVHWFTYPMMKRI